MWLHMSLTAFPNAWTKYSLVSINWSNEPQLVPATCLSTSSCAAYSYSSHNLQMWIITSMFNAMLDSMHPVACICFHKWLTPVSYCTCHIAFHRHTPQLQIKRGSCILQDTKIQSSRGHSHTPGPERQRRLQCDLIYMACFWNSCLTIQMVSILVYPCLIMTIICQPHVAKPPTTYYGWCPACQLVHYKKFKDYKHPWK